MAGMADMLRGMGGGAGGGGGMPDLASLMSNPALMQMAQGMMANGGLDSLYACLKLLLTQCSSDLTFSLSGWQIQPLQTWCDSIGH